MCLSEPRAPIDTMDYATQAICVDCGQPLDPEDGGDTRCSACLRDAYADPEGEES